MKTLLPILLILAPAAAAAAGAQDFPSAVNDAMAQISVGGLDVPPVVARSARRQRMAVAVDETLTAMNDGNQAGGEIATYAREHKVGFRFEEQPMLSRTDGKEVVLDIDISAYPRALGPRIAWEVFPMTVGYMPECAEKEYMRRSMTARVWLELGGDPKGLPVMEWTSGDKDPQLAAQMKLWLDNRAETALEKIGQATKTKTIPELLSETKDRDQVESLNLANARFTRFMIEESEWRQLNGR